MVSIGGCDYCGAYCSQLGVTPAEEFAFDNEWVPTSAIDRHRTLVARRLGCSNWDGDDYNPVHLGPLHGRRGERLDQCPHCSSSTQMDCGGWDTELDHSRCLTCWAGVEVGRVMTRHPRRPADLDEVVPGSGPAAALRSTDPADRARVAAAFRTYLGCEPPPIRWVDSPQALARAFAAAASAADPALELSGVRGAPPWALRALVRGYEDRPGAEATARAIARMIGTAPELPNPGLLAALFTDAGQFAAEPRDPVDRPRRSATDTDTASLTRLLGELRWASGPIVILPGEIVACERPLALHLDSENRPHAEDGPAIVYPDGFVVYALHGVAVPAWIVTEPEAITLGSLDLEPNVEIRRIMTERIGLERLIREGNAQLVHEDETGRLWRRPYVPPADAGGGQWDESVVVVEVVNATPEPDGTPRTYFLRVPPWTQTARAAVAWTFGMDGQAYQPDRET